MISLGGKLFCFFWAVRMVSLVLSLSFFLWGAVRMVSLGSKFLLFFWGGKDGQFGC